MGAEHSISSSVTVTAPPERVWDLACDTSRYPEWVESSLEILRTDGPARLGGTYEERTRVAGPRKVSSRWRATEVEPPRRLVFEGEGGVVEGCAMVLELTRNS